MDKGEVTTMAMLDLSAAFDTVHHTIFLNRLMVDFSICGTPLDWMASYLSDRSQQVVINGTRSDSVSISTGFPQGGGAGPWAYSRYTQPVSRIIQLLAILYHFFADDTQLYKSFKPSSIEQQTAAINSIELCIKRVSEWMFTNRLKLNMDKTEFIIFETRQQLSKVCCDSISVKNETIYSRPVVRNLGVLLDQELKMKYHVFHILQTSYMHIRKLRSLRKYITQESMKTLVHCFIISRIDYCNSLLYGISEESLDKLQRVQNPAARLIFGLRKYDNISKYLIKLHWLPVRWRIKYKIALITYKTLNDDGPEYLRELLEISQKSLRSDKHLKLTVPKSKLKNGGDRSFSVCAPIVWNSLPTEIKDKPLTPFKKDLKTVLFKRALKLK